MHTGVGGLGSGRGGEGEVVGGEVEEVEAVGDGAGEARVTGEVGEAGEEGDHLLQHLEDLRDGGGELGGGHLQGWGC